MLSGYGVHLVYVYDFQPAPEPAFADARQRVLADWQGEQQENFNAEFYQGLESQYDIVIAEPPSGRILEGSSELSANDEGESGAQASRRKAAP